MRTLLIVASALTLPLGCAGSERHTDTHPPMSAQRHLADADEHEDAAASAERQHQPETNPRDPYRCIDQPLAPDPSSGGETIRLVKPCWESERNPSAEFLRIAREQRAAAADHRKRASELVAAEREACEGLGEDEISHSPFFHREDIVGYEEIRKHGNLVGVRTRFRKVPGLTRDWMGRAVACHQARAAVMGYQPTFMTYCPLMLEDIAASVTEEGDEIVVSLRSKNDVSAAVALGRVKDLVEGAP